MTAPVELIVTHACADFDAFASMLCAVRLFPQAIPVLPSTTVYKLREVLSLYRDVADFKSIKYLHKQKDLVLDRVTVVDTKKRGQLKEFEPYLEKAGRVQIFDHHPPTSDDLTLGSLVQYPYGANATGLFLRLLDQGLELKAQEATIVLLGIYADTGNLTYPGTTAEDALAVSELLGFKADLQVVNHYLRPYFDPAQLDLFRDMLSSFHEMDLEGYKVALVKKRLSRPLRGMSELLSHVSDMVGADAILGVFASDGKPGVQIIVQSLAPEIDACGLAARFDGGGHAGAAAAFLPQADLDDVAETLLGFLTKIPLPLTKVKDVMSTEVFTVPSDLPLGEISSRLSARGVRGAPVVDGEGRMVGIISQRDVEKARQQGLLHAPASGFMSEKVLTIDSESPLVTAKKIICSNDVGRLPVLMDKRLAGIISRSNLL